MNLEQLKSTWQNQAVQTRTLESAGLQRMVSERSSNIRRRINLSIRIEVILIVLILIWGLVSQFPYATAGAKFNLGWLVVSGGVSLAFYAYKFRVLNRIDLSGLSLRDNLQELNRRMRWFMRVYDVMIVVVFPAMLVSSFIFGMFMGLSSKGKTFADVELGVWVISLVIVLAVSAGFIALSKVYIWFMYGRSFQKLKKTLAELEADNSLDDLGIEAENY